MGKNIVIIGGGIVGLSSAYYLQKEGHQVTVIDKSDLTSGASFVNAGYITPSHIIPLAAPGMISQGIKWMFNSSSPFYMKPRWDIDFFKWAWLFYKSSTIKKVEKAIPVIKDINLMSRELFMEIKRSGDLGDFQFDRKGLLMLYATEKGGEHEWQVAEKARSEGLEVKELDKATLKKLEPNIEINALGALHYECDAHMTPPEFMGKMLHYLNSQGVTIQRNEEVVDFMMTGNSLETIVTDKNIYNADEVVMASGSWSEKLSKKLKVKLPLQAGKGYRIDVKKPTGISIPTILLEAKVAITPMIESTRFAGTMEFSGINDIIRKERVMAIANAAKRYYPSIEITDHELRDAKSGLRPVSPDGLPYLGRVNNIKNLTIATGHAMMGWSLGPATGKLIEEVIGGKKTSLDLLLFKPERF